MIVTICNIIAIAIFLYMLWHVWKCETKVTCLSDIAYDKHSKLFHTCMVLMLLFLMPGILFHTAWYWCWICLLAGLSLIGVTLTPYKESKEMYNYHRIFAIVSMLLVEGLWIIQGSWFVPLLFCIAGLRKNWLLGVEMGLLASMFLYAL